MKKLAPSKSSATLNMISILWVLQLNLGCLTQRDLAPYQESNNFEVITERSRRVRPLWIEVAAPKGEEKFPLVNDKNPNNGDPLLHRSILAGGKEWEKDALIVHEFEVKDLLEKHPQQGLKCLPKKPCRSYWLDVLVSESRQRSFSPVWNGLHSKLGEISGSLSGLGDGHSSSLMLKERLQKQIKSQSSIEDLYFERVKRIENAHGFYRLWVLVALPKGFFEGLRLGVTN